MSQDTDQPPPAASDPAPADEVFSEFYRSYRPRLLRFVHSAGHSDGLSEAHLDAEGVVQETFEAAFKNWATINRPERWIYRVAARKVRQHARQEWYRDRELRQRLETVYSDKSGKDPAHVHVVAGDVIDLIRALPTNQRIATYLSTVEEWTGPEIAEVLDIAPATAYVHVSRGIKAIRDNGYAQSDGITTHAGSPPKDPVGLRPYPVPVDVDWPPALRRGGQVLVLLILAGLYFLVEWIADWPWLWLVPWLIFAGYLAWRATLKLRRPRGERRKP